jgi:hypothetical protein
MTGLFANGANQQNGSKYSIEIALSSDVTRAMCRRGRRRLRDMQASSQATLKLDHMRGVLNVTGTSESIAEVERLLECVTGPCVKVKAAVWAELMRTRMNTDPSQAAVFQIQQESGCRIHIERTSLQIRIFGPEEKVGVAQKMLATLDSMCVEEVVAMPSTDNLDEQVLQTFASDYGVTVQVAETQIILLGFQIPVLEAANKLRDCGLDQKVLSREIGIPSDIARGAIDAAIGKLKMNTRQNSNGNLSSPSTTASSFNSEDGYNPPTNNNFLDGSVLAKMPPVCPRSQRSQPKKEEDAGQLSSFSPCKTCGVAGNFCVRCGQPSRRMPPAIGACPTCGAGNFCVYCGEPTEKFPLGNDKSNGNAQGASPSPYGMPQPPMMPFQFPPAMNGLQMPSVQRSGGPQMMMPQGMMMAQGNNSAQMMMYIPAGMMPSGGLPQQVAQY